MWEALHASGAPPDLDWIRRLFPPLVGDPAFDPEEIRDRVARLQTTPPVNTGHPYLNLSVKTGLAFIDATFLGDQPRYGVKHYAEPHHNGFPPTIIAAVDALSAWGCVDRAVQLFNFWLLHFVNADGTVTYYGPSLSEYGQLLHTAALLQERADGQVWWISSQTALSRLAGYVTELCAQAEAGDDLVAGIPEADIAQADPNNLSDTAHNEHNRYFHNNAWLARGLLRWAQFTERGGVAAAPPVRSHAERLAQRTLAAIQDTWPADVTQWWLPPQVEAAPVPASLTATTYASYTNSRYWPELLSSGLLPLNLAHRVVNTRLQAGGQFCGMTRFEERLDDWPLADYLYGLWQLGRKQDFLLSLYGHVAHHQAGGHLTAYEQVTLPPGRELAPYCLPCQLVAARAARHLQFGV